MAVRPLNRTRRRLLGALVCLCALALLAPGCAVEALFLWGLHRVGELPSPPRRPTVLIVHRALWAIEDELPMRVEFMYPWVVFHNYRNPRGRQSAGAHVAAGAASAHVASVTSAGRPPRHLDYALRVFATTIWFTRTFSAEELVVWYGERACFGPDAVGLAQAARHYFGKTPEQLELHEAALLAAVLSSPSRYDPWCRPDAARARRAFTLSRLRDSGAASPAEVEKANSQPLGIVARPCSE